MIQNENECLHLTFFDMILFKISPEKFVVLNQTLKYQQNISFLFIVQTVENKYEIII